MSYPPQQGGPQDQPTGQNPNQYGQNQGHYPGQYQGQSQYGQGQYGQYPGYQGPHQQQGQPGYPPYGPPQKSYTGIIIAIVVVVFLLLLGGGLALFLTARASGDHTSTEPPVSAPAPVPTAPSEPTQPTEPTRPTQSTQPTQPTQSAPPLIPTPGSNPADVAAVRTLAQKYATAINTENEAAATALTCGTNTPGIAYTIAAGRYNSVTVDSVRVDSSLSAQIALKLSASSPVPLSLVAFNRDNRWCVLI